MSKVQNIDHYFNSVIKCGLYSTKGNLQFQMDTLFRGIDFKNKKMLDIGGGCGIYSFYAAYKGASSVICLEPEADGSSSGVTHDFLKLKKLLECDNVELRPQTLQELEPESEKFDVILLHDSINHLDEKACVNLLVEPESKAKYQSIFSNVYSLSNSGAKLIICDCSRFNFFAMIKIRNPFCSMIEWHKHQAPEVWANLLSLVGFANPRIRWSSFNRLRNFGRIVAGNKIVAYFFKSHFCLAMDKP